MPNCLQCGRCCLGLDWTFTFACDKEENPENPSREMMQKAIRRMRFYGLLHYEFKSAELRDNSLAMTFSVGVCQHLRYDGGKAHCQIHENRPAACRDYYCERAKDN